MTIESFLRAKDREPSTLRAAKLALSKFTATFPEPDNLDAEALRQWRDSLRGAAGYKNLTLAWVRAYLRYTRDVVEADVRPRVFRALEPFGATKRLIQTFTAEETRALAEAAVAQEAWNVLVVLTVGCRRNELDAMRNTPEGLLIVGHKTRRQRRWPWELLGSAAALFKCKLKPIRKEWKYVRETAGVRRYPVKALRATLASRLCCWPRLTLLQVSRLIGNSPQVLEAHYLGEVSFAPVVGDTVPQILNLDDLFANL